MNRESIEQQKSAIIQEFGQWTNHNIQLQEDIYTIGQESITGAEVKLRRFLQMIADLSNKPFKDLRVLDLACLEGLYGLELALQGAKVMAIEGREANLAKARFTQDILSLDQIEFVQDDVRNLSKEKYGTFDVVLCIGIFYHLNAPDIFEFIEKISEVCDQFAIIDTHVSQVADSCYSYKNKNYWGRSYEEPPDTLWSSIGNSQSVWLTRSSFYNLASQVGFTSIYECYYPPVLKYEVMRLKQEADRRTFLAMKGKPVQLRSSQMVNQFPLEDWPETQQLLG